MEADAEPAQQDDHCWTDDMASRVFKVFCALQNELMQTQVISLLLEWCETPEMREPAGGGRFSESTERQALGSDGGERHQGQGPRESQNRQEEKRAFSSQA